MVLGNCSNFKDHLLKMFPVCQGMLPGVDFKLTELDPFSLYNPNVMIANIFLLILSQPVFSALHKYSNNPTKQLLSFPFF